MYSAHPRPFVPIIEKATQREQYAAIDLSPENPELSAALIQDPQRCETYIKQYCEDEGAEVAFGGYFENRELYSSSALFQGEEARNIHLGIDFWCGASHFVVAPFAGRIHSFANNTSAGDYGPTLILEHRAEWFETPFEGFTLYGHLAVTSMTAWSLGKPIQAGDLLAKLGVPSENGGYAPHLHFQMMVDLQGHMGDYPGVCSPSSRSFYASNCPNPLPFLGF